MGWFGRKKDDGTAVPTDSDREAFREAARERIRPGFMDLDGVAETLVEYLEDVELPEDVMLELARATVAEEWAARLAEQATWTEPGDYARVQAAYDDLAGQGIVGRMNFTCCQTCGTDEIDDERTPRSSEEVEADAGYGFHEWGYTFFHQQDAERLADEPAVLYLSYSTFLPAPEVDPDLIARAGDGDADARSEVVQLSDLAAGRAVAAALTRQGLSVDWAEDTSQRIRVTDLRWRKPLPG